MRKTKQVKRKEVIYSIEEWEEIKRLAETASLKTGTYIKRISLNGKTISTRLLKKQMKSTAFTQEILKI